MTEGRAERLADVQAGALPLDDANAFGQQSEKLKDWSSEKVSVTCAEMGQTVCGCPTDADDKPSAYKLRYSSGQFAH